MLGSCQELLLKGWFCSKITALWINTTALRLTKRLIFPPIPCLLNVGWEKDRNNIVKVLRKSGCAQPHIGYGNYVRERQGLRLAHCHYGVKEGWSYCRSVVAVWSSAPSETNTYLKAVPLKRRGEEPQMCKSLQEDKMVDDQEVAFGNRTTCITVAQFYNRCNPGSQQVLSRFQIRIAMHFQKPQHTKTCSTIWGYLLKISLLNITGMSRMRFFYFQWPNTSYSVCRLWWKHSV